MKKPWRNPECSYSEFRSFRGKNIKSEQNLRILVGIPPEFETLRLAMSLFGLKLAKSLELCHKISSKTDAVQKHVSECDAAESYHVLHMGPNNYDALSNKLMSPHQKILNLDSDSAKKA
jgi:hypothetical protein